jgi:hypothetical protein
VLAPSKNPIKSTVLTQLALERIKHFLFEDQRNKTRHEKNYGSSGTLYARSNVSSPSYFNLIYPMIEFVLG